MYSLLVLGIIPGTNIQISFQVWLQFASVLTGVVMATVFLRVHRASLSRMLHTRTPLHASQLHSRLSF
jgi:hypothetical protein